MNIGVVTDDEDIARIVAEEAARMGHETLRRPDIAGAVRDQAAIIFAHWAPGPQFALVLQEIVQFSTSVPPTPIVALVDSFSLWERARQAGAFDAVFCPPEPAEIRGEIESLTGSEVPFNPVERERFERFRGQFLIGENPAFRRCLDDARLVAQSDVNVLVLGNSGTGKDLLARLIHHLGPRSSHPFIALNCGAIGGELSESELFGAMRGAFTGADRDREGVFEQVGAGTLFLDEIGEMKLEHQVKLLRAIEQKEFRRLGATFTSVFKGRLICATAKDLDRAVEQGSFRLDLLGRINQLRITLPSLRERRDDIPELAEHFLRKHSPGRHVEFSRTTLKVLAQREYPDNLRGLENAVVRAITLSAGATTILSQHLPTEIPQNRAPGTQPPATAGQLPDDFFYKDAREEVCRAFDRLYLGKLLEKYPRNRRALAREAGIDHKTLDARLADAFPELEDQSDE